MVVKLALHVISLFSYNVFALKASPSLSLSASLSQSKTRCFPHDPCSLSPPAIETTIHTVQLIERHWVRRRSLSMPTQSHTKVGSQLSDRLSDTFYSSPRSFSTKVSLWPTVQVEKKEMSWFSLLPSQSNPLFCCELAFGKFMATRPQGEFG